MSDGERSIFYMIGQVLVAAEGDPVLIIDEPELHIHRSIMSKLWDELQAARPDCAFIFITHDLGFAAARLAQKFSIEDYRPTPWWKLKPVPPETGFDEATATLILGSRVPVLFVEGTNTSLDNSIYRCCFPGWTVIPRGSCQEVIHAVTTMRANSELTRIRCAELVDSDGFTQSEEAFMAARGIGYPARLGDREPCVIAQRQLAPSRKARATSALDCRNASTISPMLCSLRLSPSLSRGQSSATASGESTVS